MPSPSAAARTGLATLKTFDKKIFEHATQNLPAETGLRAVNLHELLHADRKLWHEIASLHSQGWTLDDAMHELSNVRSDMHALLQPRARPPKAPQQPGKGGRDPARPSKGGGKPAHQAGRARDAHRASNARRPARHQARQQNHMPAL